jgi:MOSC domain-containing protein YiiM
MSARIVSLSRSPLHDFSKDGATTLRLIAGIGVEGDAHAGEKVQHRSRAAVDPTLPNLRQVHLLSVEILHDLKPKGFSIKPGQLGENILTHDVDLLGLPTGTRLALGDEAEIEITGLRNPCKQIESFETGLLEHLAYRDASGELIRLVGVMAVVLRSGEILLGDPIQIRFPDSPHRLLVPV